MHDATNNPFWSYSLTQYSNPDCETFCLNAQNQFGLDVNMLLFSVWLGTQGKRLDMDAIAALPIQQLRQQVVAPIRTLRRSFKQNQSFSAEEKAALYERLKAAELKAEQQQQWMLFQFAQTLPDQEVSEDSSHHSLGAENLMGYLEKVGWNKEGKENWVQTAMDCLYPYNH